MATLYRANGTPTPIKPKKGKRFTVGELQKLVGGYVELIPIPGHYLAVNEDGKLLDLNYNSNATRLVHQFGYGYVVGDAVYCDAEQIDE